MTAATRGRGGWRLLLPSIAVLGVLLLPVLIFYGLRSEADAYARRLAAGKQRLRAICSASRSYSTGPRRSGEVLQRLGSGSLDRTDLVFRDSPPGDGAFVFLGESETDMAVGYERIAVFVRGAHAFDLKIPAVRVHGPMLSLAAPKYRYIICTTVRNDDLTDYFG